MTGRESVWAHLPNSSRFVPSCLVSSQCGWSEEEEGEFDLGLGVIAATRLAGRRAQNSWLSLSFFAPYRDLGRIWFLKSWLIQRPLPRLLEREIQVQLGPQVLQKPQAERGPQAKSFRVPALGIAKIHIQPTRPVWVQVRPSKCIANQDLELCLL